MGLAWGRASLWSRRRPPWLAYEPREPGTRLLLAPSMSQLLATSSATGTHNPCRQADRDTRMLRESQIHTNKSHEDSLLLQVAAPGGETDAMELPLLTAHVNWGWGQSTFYFSVSN